MNKAIRYLIGMLWYGFAGLIVLAAVMLTLMRVLLPLAEDYRSEAQAALSDYAGQPIQVASLKAEWNGFDPQLHFSNVQLFDKQGEKVLFEFTDAKMGLDIFASIRHLDFVPASFTISGVELSITRHADNRFSIDGLSTEENSQANYSDKVTNWLLRQPNIGIESSTIIWTDIPLNEQRISFKEVDLQLMNDSDTHQLTGRMLLPEKLGQEINIALELKGEIGKFSEWNGDIYINAKALLTAAWWRKPLAKGVSLAGGKADFEVWGKWQNNSLQSLEGKIAAADLAFNGKRANDINWQAVDTEVLWSQNNEEWNLHLNKLLLKTKQSVWPKSDLNVRYHRVTQRIAAASKYLQLSDVVPVIDAFQVLESEFSKKLTYIKPQGVLQNTTLLFALKGKEWHVDGRFSDLNTNSYKDMPGVNGLAGSFVANNERGNLQMDSNKVAIDTAGLFREQVELLKLTGSMQWEKNDKGWLIDLENVDALNNDVALRAAMSLSLPEAGTPVIDLLVDFKNADASKVSKYLPVTLLSEKTIAWLDKSIIEGSSPTGKFLLRGPLDKFPFDYGEGKFEVRFDVVNGKLDYESGWPLISDMQGEVVFSGRSLDIFGRAGKILNATIHDVTARIADIDIEEPILELKGDVKASTIDLIKYVNAAKLAEGYSNELAQLDTQGDALLNLNIVIPTTSGDGTVNGVATLQNARLGIKGEDIQLQNINGKVSVSNKGLQGQGINARLFNTPVELKITHGDNAATGMSLSAKGKLDLNKLVKEKFNKDIPVISEGATDWLAKMSFRNPEGDTHPIELSLESDLRNADVKLPAPFAKAVGVSIPLKLRAFIEEDKDIQVNIDYGNNTGAIVAFKKINNNYEYAGTSIAFGDTLPIPPSTARVSIVGKLDSVSVDDWLSYLSRENLNNNESAEPTSMPWLEDVNLDVASLKALGSEFAIKNFKLFRKENHWQSFISADRIKGELLIPFNTKTDIVKANLEFLKIDRLESDTNDINLDPRELPGIEVSVKQLFFDGAELGALNAKINKTTDGLSLDALSIISPELEFTASGLWKKEVDEQATRFNAKLKSQKFSKFLKSLGYSVGFEAGKSRNAAQLTWRGSPFQFALNKISGKLQIRIDNGQLQDVSPGAGRVFGLLSLQALPRRLTLDFSDVFKKGFSFDRIKGSFQIDAGDAYTTDLYLDGPAARLDVSGRTGLVVRDYDQLVTVTPNLTGSLPLAGAIVGGPLAGGVVFALDKLFRPAIDDITRYQYTVTGGWDDPQVVKLKEEIKPVAGIEESE